MSRAKGFGGYSPSISPLGSALRDRLAAPYAARSLAGRARARRWRRLLRTFPDLEASRVVDLGGTIDAWLQAPVHPRELVLVNVEAVPPGGASLPDWVTVVRADACRPGDALRGERFDLVYSNSVIEHVGGHRRRAEFADVARALADRYWVQTPSRRFPIEPHFLFPGFVLLPLSLKVAVARHWPLSWLRRPGTSREEALAHVLDIELLTPRLMRSYFPDGHVTREWFGPFTKSLIAVR